MVEFNRPVRSPALPASTCASRAQTATACTDAIVEEFCKRRLTDYVRQLTSWHGIYRYGRIFVEPGFDWYPLCRMMEELSVQSRLSEV